MTFDQRVSKAPNIPSLFFDTASTYSEKSVFLQPIYDEGNARFVPTRYGNVAARVKAIAKYLSSLGVKNGSPVSIISGTRPEWMEIDLAILSLGAVTVSIYPSLPHGDCGFILFDSGAKIVFAENEEQLNKLRTLEVEDTSIPERDNLPAQKVRLSFDKIITIEETTDHPKAESLATIVKSFTTDEIPESVSHLSRDDVSSLVYTSGTTGPSKGVVQTHGNHLANVEQAIKSGMFALDGTLFLFLPLAHSFARLIAYLVFLTPATGIFCSVADRRSSKVDLGLVAKELHLSNANVLPSVPRLFEKIKATLEEKSHHPSLRGKLLQKTLQSARSVYSSESSNPSVIDWLFFFVTKPIRSKIKRMIFGGDFWHAIAGGAKMPSDVSHFFWSLGIPIYEGYGLTETCVATNVNRIGHHKIGSVGPALEGVQTKIADDGEILFKGPNITKGYFNRPIASKESWDNEGWFHTGDVGHLDEDGFLFITDRKKDLVITAGGKKIPPQKVENLLSQSPFICQAIFMGDGKPYCVALVTLHEGTVRQALQAKGITPLPELHKQKEVLALLEEGREQTNRQLSSFEAVKKIAVIPDEFSVENGLLTPTLKVKRKVAMARYQALFESLYDT